MQTFGYLSSMLSIIKKLYPKHEDQVKAIQAYTAFLTQIQCLERSLLV